MTEMPEEPTAAEYGMVMPFVVCTSKGGPYDDQAFVAGYTAGTIDTVLRSLIPVSGEVRWYVPSDLVPQLDLVAMRHGYVMTAEPWEAHPEEWTLVTFGRKPDGV